ncbi:DUF3040 family protein [Pseudonocardia hierapolitana]|uniref:DUF3040 family protein n=1 Tax=Pseudonocardia hierapolitana TaxID=1128676 RepID=A0A561SW89_9PSEU|nr:DUF3040 domain-containing protein [Pseudonocardia hierapolitana]TWF79127.1 DUF3040 family protein [Pseudonocardia hierapolitana]
MFNQNDRRRLEEIERRLQQEDPEFARRFTRWPAPAGGGSRLLPTLVLVVGVLGLMMSMLVALPAVFLLSLVATVWGGVWLHRRRS